MAFRVNIETPVTTVQRVVVVPYTQIPGIGVAAAYAAGDAFGGKFVFLVPKSGVIEAVIYLDLDDEGIETEIWCFDRDFAGTADNAAWAPSDIDLQKLVAVISITNFANAANNQVGINNGLQLPYTAPSGKLYCQCVTRGSPNIAADNLPLISLRVINQEVQ